MEDWVHEYAALESRIADTLVQTCDAMTLEQCAKYTLQARRLDHMLLGFTMCSSRDIIAMNALICQCSKDLRFGYSLRDETSLRTERKTQRQ